MMEQQPLPPVEDLRKKVLFLCTGNTCRSPMAAGIFNRLLEQEGKDGEIVAISAGLGAYDGQSASPHAVQALKEMGIDLSAHRSQRMNMQLLGEAEWFVCLGESHRKAMEPYFKEPGKLFLLGEGISDPFGGDLNTYRTCRDEIQSACQTLYRQLFGAPYEN